MLANHWGNGRGQDNTLSDLRRTISTAPSQRRIRCTNTVGFYSCAGDSQEPWSRASSSRLVTRWLRPARGQFGYYAIGESPEGGIGRFRIASSESIDSKIKCINKSKEGTV